MVKHQVIYIHTYVDSYFMRTTDFILAKLLKIRVESPLVYTYVCMYDSEYICLRWAKKNANPARKWQIQMKRKFNYNILLDYLHFLALFATDTYTKRKQPDQQQQQMHWKRHSFATHRIVRESPRWLTVQKSNNKQMGQTHSYKHTHTCNTLVYISK